MGIICTHDYDQGGCSICHARDEENYRIRLRNEEMWERDRFDSSVPRGEPYRKPCECVVELEWYQRRDGILRFCQSPDEDEHKDYFRWKAVSEYQAGRLKVGQTINVTWGHDHARATIQVPLANVTLVRTWTTQGAPSGGDDWYSQGMREDEAWCLVKATQRIRKEGLRKGAKFEEVGYRSRYQITVR